MREALAATNHDFILSEKASKPRRLQNAFGAARRSGWLSSSQRGKPTRKMLAIGLSTVLAATILFNALSWQKTRHPAPLFAHAASPTLPPREPKIAETMAAPSHSKPQAVPATVHDRPVEKLPTTNSSPPQPADEIAKILTATPPKAASAPRAKPDNKAPPSRAQKPAQASAEVLKAQRALVRLGYVLKPDGIAGVTTRQAVAHYERDHALPAQGLLTPALTQRLLAEAGVADKQ